MTAAASNVHVLPVSVNGGENYTILTIRRVFRILAQRNFYSASTGWPLIVNVATEALLTSRARAPRGKVTVRCS